MCNKTLITCAAAVLPLCAGTTALAQSVTPAPAAAQPAEGYSLTGTALKPPSADGQQVTAAPYAISGTGFSGTERAANSILTVAIPQGAAPFKTESGIYLYPTVFTGIGYNDNVQLTPTNTIGSSFIHVAPQLVAELKHKGDRYTALAAVNRTVFSSSSPDNFTTSEFELAGDNYFNARARAGWAVGYVNGTDQRGTTNRTASTELDRWHTASVNGRLIYGAPEAPGRIEVDLGSRAKTYDNNRTVTASGDVTVNSVGGRLFYRLGSRSLALVEIRNDKANYSDALSTSGNTERRYYLGYTWDATAATTGIVKIGRMTKDFDAANREGYGGGSWEAAVRWSPRTYSVFELQTGRATSDASGVGTYELNTTTSLSWKHNWTKSLSSEAAISNLNRSYGGSARTDTVNSYSLAVDYSVLRWLKVGVDLSKTDLSSNDPTAEYKRNVMMFTLNASL